MKPLALTGLLLTALALPGRTQEDPQGQPIRIGIQQEPSSLFPRMSSMAAASEIRKLLFASLVTMDENWRLRPIAAETLPTRRNGLWKVCKDDKGRVVGMTVTWKLRRTLKWSDGKPVTAADYIFAHEVLTHPKVRVTDRTVEARIERLVAQDPYTLIVHWKGAFAYANCFGMKAHLALPRHLLEKAFRAAPDKLHELPYATRPVGNGPFILTEWIPGKRLTLTANPHWYTGTPPTPKIVYQLFSSSAKTFAALREDRIDAISPPSAPVARIRAFAKQAAEGFQTEIRPGVTWEHIDFNLNSEILKDRRVRQALLLALDRKQMLRTLFGRKYPVAHSWLPSWHYGYARRITHFHHDPERAAKLLEAAGWTRPAPGAMRHRVGAPTQRLTLEFVTTSGNARREKIQRLLKAQWRKLGVEIVIKNEPARLLFGKTLRQRRFKHLALYAWIMGPLSDGEDLWSGARIPKRSNGWSGQN